MLGSYLPRSSPPIPYNISSPLIFFHSTGALDGPMSVCPQWLLGSCVKVFEAEGKAGLMAILDAGRGLCLTRYRKEGEGGREGGKEGTP